MFPPTSTSPPATANKLLRVALWAAQALVGLPFILFGLMKLTMPIPQLSVTMVWTGQLPEIFVRTMGVIDIAGGIGILLPALTRIRPGITPAAALGCTLLQISAILFHTARGEAAATPLNFLLLALSAFVLWGRTRKAPLQARGM